MGKQENAPAVSENRPAKENLLEKEVSATEKMPRSRHSLEGYDLDILTAILDS